MNEKVPCSKCETLILERTSIKNSGLCCPCYKEIQDNESQSFFNAVFHGPKDISAAHRVIRIAVYMSVLSAFLSAAFGVAGIYKTGTSAISQFLLDPWLIADSILILILAFFLNKRKIWAAGCLIGGEVLAAVNVYLELEKLPSAIRIFTVILYFSALKSIHFINKARESSDKKI